MLNVINDHQLTINNIFHLELLAGSAYAPPEFSKVIEQEDNFNAIIECIKQETSIDISPSNLNELLSDILNHNIKLFVLEFSIPTPYDFRFGRGGVISHYSFNAGKMINGFFCGDDLDSCIDKAVDWRNACFSKLADQQRLSAFCN